MGDETPCLADEEPPEHTRDHDVVMMWNGDSPHPTAIRCEECDWTGVIHDGI